MNPGEQIGIDCRQCRKKILQSVSEDAGKSFACVTHVCTIMTRLRAKKEQEQAAFPETDVLPPSFVVQQPYVLTAVRPTVPTAPPEMTSPKKLLVVLTSRDVTVTASDKEKISMRAKR